MLNFDKQLLTQSLIAVNYYRLLVPCLFISTNVKQENTPAVSTQNNQQDGTSVESTAAETELKVYVEKELVSQAEEEDMEALLGTQVLSFSLKLY